MHVQATHKAIHKTETGNHLALVECAAFS
jgi:hypothetical protein